jgi:hypothetical protein
MWYFLDVILCASLVLTFIYWSHKYCNVFVGSLFMTELYCTQNSIHNLLITVSNSSRILTHVRMRPISSDLRTQLLHCFESSPLYIAHCRFHSNVSVYIVVLLWKCHKLIVMQQALLRYYGNATGCKGHVTKET